MMALALSAGAAILPPQAMAAVQAGSSGANAHIWQQQSSHAATANAARRSEEGTHIYSRSGIATIQPSAHGFFAPQLNSAPVASGIASFNTQAAPASYSIGNSGNTTGNGKLFHFNSDAHLPLNSSYERGFRERYQEMLGNPEGAQSENRGGIGGIGAAPSEDSGE